MSCPRLSLVLRGFKRLRSGNSVKKPIKSIHLLRFFDNLKPFVESHNVRLYITVLSVAFQGLLRVSEYAANHRHDLSYRTLRLANIRFYPTKSSPSRIEILLARSKTNQYGVCKEAVAFECTCSSNICAFHRLLEYLEHCHSNSRSSDPLFAFASGAILSKRDVNRLIDKMCDSISLDKRDYSSHSMRSGGATELYLAGVPLDLIQRIGRWSPTGTTLQSRYLKPTPIQVRELVQISIQKNRSSSVRKSRKQFDRKTTTSSLTYLCGL